MYILIPKLVVKSKYKNIQILKCIHIFILYTHKINIYHFIKEKPIYTHCNNNNSNSYNKNTNYSN